MQVKNMYFYSLNWLNYYDLPLKIYSHMMISLCQDRRLLENRIHRETVRNSKQYTLQSRDNLPRPIFSNWSLSNSSKQEKSNLLFWLYILNKLVRFEETMTTCREECFYCFVRKIQEKGSSQTWRKLFMKVLAITT